MRIRSLTALLAASLFFAQLTPSVGAASLPGQATRHAFQDNVVSEVGRLKFNCFGNSNAYQDEWINRNKLQRNTAVNVKNLGKINASQATYTNNGNEVYKAYLIYSGNDVHKMFDTRTPSRYIYNTIAPDGRTIDFSRYPMTLVAPNGAEFVAYPDMLSNLDESYETTTAICDVTDFIRTNGAGVYTGEDISFINYDYERSDHIASWQVIVLEANDQLPLRHIMLKLGGRAMHRKIDNGIAGFDFSGFTTSRTGSANAELLFVANGGDDYTRNGAEKAVLTQYSNGAVVANKVLSDKFHRANDFFRGKSSKDDVLIGGMTPDFYDSKGDLVCDRFSGMDLIWFTKMPISNNVNRMTIGVYTNDPTSSDHVHMSAIGLAVDIQ